MAAELSVRQSGAWAVIDAAGVYARVAGVWQQVDFGYVKASGVWQTFYVKDNVGPGAPTNLKVSFVSNGSAICNWTTPSDADYSYMQVSAKYTGGATLLAATNIVGAASTAQSRTITVPATGTVVDFYLTPYDSNGNPGATYIVQSHDWSGTPRGRVASPSFFAASDSGTYRGAGWRGDVGNRLYQGTTSNGANYGAYFYGNTIYNSIHGAAISAGVVSVKRVNSGGLGGTVYPDLWWSSCASQATSPVGNMFNESLKTGNPLCRNGSCPTFDDLSLTSLMFDNMTLTTAPRFGSLIFYSATNDGDPSSTYMQLYAYNEAPGDVYPGVITLTHGG